MLPTSDFLCTIGQQCQFSLPDLSLLPSVVFNYYYFDDLITAYVAPFVDHRAHLLQELEAKCAAACIITLCSTGLPSLLILYVVISDDTIPLP